MESHSDAMPEPPAVTIPRLSWPPPGLEPLQSVLWPLLRRFGVGAALFAFPLLIAIATPQGFASLRPFGRSFWIPATLAFVAPSGACRLCAARARGPDRCQRYTLEAAVPGFDYNVVPAHTTL
ncbi:MAG: hypothetical protein WEE89_21465 [Gemmatimonadota bacterium]